MVIKITKRTKELELMAQTTYYVRSRKLNRPISIHSHYKSAIKHFNDLKRKLSILHNPKEVKHT